MDFQVILWLKKKQKQTFGYMEQYIKAVMYGKYKKYLEYVKG